MTNHPVRPFIFRPEKVMINPWCLLETNFSFLFTEDSLGDQPLYTGASITLAASMILIISFAMRHALTGEALADLLVLLELHCLSPNLCSRNLRTFMNFFSSLKSPLEFHYYCEMCLVYHGTEKQNMCQKCGTATRKRTTSYFLVIPVVSQLSSLFAGILIALICNIQILC